MALLERTVSDWKEICSGIRKVMTTEIKSPELSTVLLCLPILYICLESVLTIKGEQTVASRFSNYLVQETAKLENVPNYH